MSITDFELVSETREASRTPKSEKSNDIKCDSVALCSRKNGWSFDVSTHSNSHLYIWVTRGGGRANIDGTARGFGANTAMFVPSLTMYGFSFSPGTQGWIASIGSACDIPLPQHPILRTVSNLNEQVKLVGHFDALNDELRRDDPECASALLYQAAILSIWYRRFDAADQGATLSPGAARRKLMRKFLQLMEERYCTPDTVNDYATNLDVTSTHLTRICRQTTGKPASTLIQERVLQEARKSLTNTDQRVSEIAEKLGYSNPAYFTRQFTERVGETPTEFRRHAG